MSKTRTIYRCTDCGAAAPKWTGRCSACAGWNTLAEEVEPVRPSARRPTSSAAAPITTVDGRNHAPRPTGVDELDRVLGGGLVRGSVTLVGGEPGVGKSTLLLDVAGRVAGAGERVLYVSGEESAEQVRARAERLGALHPDLWLLSETVLPNMLAAIDQVDPALVIVDSIQTTLDPELGSTPGSVVQVRECAARLVQEAKARAVAILLVGHVTKDGGLAGPRLLEHIVDTVLAFEGDRHHALRLLRAAKHRFGPTSELGLFEMTDAGLVGVPDPSGLFLADRHTGLAGSAVVPVLEGRRPLLVEVQGLVAPAASPANARRSAQGLDQGRLAMLLAVLERRAGLAVAGADVYVSVVGGVRLSDPGADLAVALAIASAATGHPLPAALVACGEIGLAGELRQASQTPRRLAEAARLGFDRALAPSSAPATAPGIAVHRVDTLAEAIQWVGIGAATRDEPQSERARAPTRHPANGRLRSADGEGRPAARL